MAGGTGWPGTLILETVNKDISFEIATWVLRLIPKRLRHWFYVVTHLTARAEYIKEYFADKGVFQRGTLEGVKYTSSVSWNQGLDRYSQAMGFYEKDILEIILSDIRSRTGRQNDKEVVFVHVGCSDGLMAAGIALNSQVNSLVLIDSDPNARRLASVHAELNNLLGRVEILDSIHELPKFLKGKDAFILLDIEGAEYELLTTEFLNHTLESHLYIETHQENSPRQEAAAKLCMLLGKSHLVSTVQPTVDLVARWFDEQASAFNSLSEYKRFCLVSEGRSHAQTWVIARPLGADIYPPSSQKL